MSEREPEDGAVTAAQAAAGETTDYGNNTEPPGDVLQAADGFGTTPGEVREGESLDGRLAREEPETGPSAEPDRSSDPAEESAMHVVPEA